MSTVKQIRVGKNGSLIDIESVNDSQHANFATSTTLDALNQKVTTLETELNTKVAALEALNIQSKIEALVARIEALENGGGNQGGNTEPEEPEIPETIDVDGVTYYKTQPEKPGENYELHTHVENGVTYYEWI